MTLVRVKEKFQVTLPAEARKKMKLEVGDLLEADVERDRLVLSPKRAIDLELAKALEDVRKGRTHGPFRSADEAIRFIRKKLRSR